MSAPIRIGAKGEWQEPRALQVQLQGIEATDIGGILGLSGRTVEGHLIKLCGHLGVKTRIQAVVRARARPDRAVAAVRLRARAA